MSKLVAFLNIRTDFPNCLNDFPDFLTEIPNFLTDFLNSLSDFPNIFSDFPNFLYLSLKFSNSNYLSYLQCSCAGDLFLALQSESVRRDDFDELNKFKLK